MSGSEESSVKRRIDWSIGRFIKDEFKKYKLRNKYSEHFEVSIGNNKTTWYLAATLTEENNGIGYCGFYLYNKSYSNSDNFAIKLAASIQESSRELGKTVHIEKKSSEFQSGRGWGLHKFMKIDDIFDVNDGCVVDGCLNFICDLELVKEKETKSHQCECEDTFTHLNADNFNSEKFSDFTFISSDGIKIPVHRCIVACRSKVLEKMFSAEMIESKTKQVILEDIDGKTMMEMLRYIYKGEVENIDSIASSLLYAAEKYDLAHLKSMCLESLIKNLSEANVFEILILADQCNEKLLMEKCIKLIKKNFYDLQTSDGWKNLGHEIMVKIMISMKDDAFYIPLKSVL